MQKNEIYQTEFIDYTSDGAAIARIDGRVVFVPGGAIGDLCEIRIVKVNKTTAYGRLERILRPSPDRIDPECPHTAQCGGCSYWHISYEAELAAKKKKVETAVHRLGGCELSSEGIVGSDSVYSYRNKAQYPVGNSANGIITGFYRARSHSIIPTDRCLIQAACSDQLACCVREWMERYSVPAYDEGAHRGAIRHVYTRIGENTGEVLLCLVTATRHLPHMDELVSMARRTCPQLVGIILNLNTKPGNAILGKQYQAIWGRDYLEDTLCGNRFRISPATFYQVNHNQAERLYQCAIEYADLTPDSTVLDLYCGVGTITLALARNAKHVIGAEIVPQSIENARKNAVLNNLEHVEFICADAGTAAQKLAQRGLQPDVIVVDPPRKGIDQLTVDSIAIMSPKKVVYVSCDPATMARDIKLLRNVGYQLVRYRVFDLFPRTFHVETVALMSRVKE